MCNGSKDRDYCYREIAILISTCISVAAFSEFLGYPDSHMVIRCMSFALIT